MALDFVAGCLGGVGGVLVGHPFDTVKVHLQTQCYKNPVYKGTFHCLKTIIAKDSFRGLYRGVTSPMGGIAFVNAIVFGVYGNVQRQSKEPNSLFSHFLAGSTAGLAQSLVCSPMELVKTRLQLQNNIKTSPGFNGPMECLRHIWKHEGLRGVYRGLGITAVRDVPGFSSYFVAYELMTRSEANPSAFYTLMAGGFAGTFSWLITFPIDVVKSRFQANGMNGKLEYTGLIDCIRKSYQTEGLSFLSRGLASTLLRAFPMNAVCFLIVSYTMKLFGGSEINIELNSPTDTPLTMVNVGPLIMPIMPNHDRDHHLYRFKMNTMKSLIMLGAFSEAVCSSEIVEIANDLYDVSGFCQNYYYQQEIDAYSHYDIVLRSVECNARNSYPLLSD